MEREDKKKRMFASFLCCTNRKQEKSQEKGGEKKTLESSFLETREAEEREEIFQMKLQRTKINLDKKKDVQFLKSALKANLTSLLKCGKPEGCSAFDFFYLSCSLFPSLNRGEDLLLSRKIRPVQKDSGNGRFRFFMQSRKRGRGEGRKKEKLLRWSEKKRFIMRNLFWAPQKKVRWWLRKKK